AYRTPQIGTMTRLWLVSVLVVIGLAGVAHSTPLNCDTLVETEFTEGIGESELPGGIAGAPTPPNPQPCATDEEWCGVLVKNVGGTRTYSKKCVPAQTGTGIVCSNPTPQSHMCACKADNCNKELDDIYKNNRDAFWALFRLEIHYRETEQKFYRMIMEAPRRFDPPPTVAAPDPTTTTAETTTSKAADATTATTGAGGDASTSATDSAGSLSLLLSIFFVVIRQFV
ncbi:hypothetical protein PFISCL1PPCAC_16843, partial [Pristionchus fissidentatus]